jgi:hypothetical protein
MKTKKYVIAIAIFGGMLFTAQAANLFQANEDAPKIERSKIKIPGQGQGPQ